MNNYERQKSIVEQNLGNIYKSEDSNFEAQGREHIEKAEQAETSTPHLHQQLIKSQIAGCFNADSPQVTDEELEQSADIFLEKGGKRAVIGEKRTFGGREYIKTSAGWKFHGKGGGAKATAHREGALDHHVETGKSVATKEEEQYDDKFDKESQEIKRIEADSGDAHEDDAATEAFKTNHAAATKEQREQVASDYFGDKNKDLLSVGAHHHEQLSEALYEKVQTSKPKLEGEEAGKTHSSFADNRDRGTGYVYNISQDGQITSSGNLRHNKKFKTPELAQEYLKKQGFTLREDSPKPTSKHIGDMSLKEKKAAAEKLGISTEGKTVKQIDKELADANVDKAIADFKEKKGSAVTGDPENDDHGAALILLQIVDSDEELLNDYELSQETIDAARDLERQGFEGGEAFDHKEYEDAEKYRAKMEKKGYEVHEVNDGSDMISFIIKKGEGK
jgi:protein-tyrosine-phosphatase